MPRSFPIRTALPQGEEKKGEVPQKKNLPSHHNSSPGQKRTPPSPPRSKERRGGGIGRFSGCSLFVMWVM